MSFRAELVIQDEIFVVRQFSWAISQQTDQLGRPDARVHGGTLELTLDAPPSDLLQDWARSHTKRLNGRVQVYEADSATVRDVVSFFAAHCTSLHRDFQDAHAAQGMTMVLALSANKLQYAKMEVHNRWPDIAE